MPSTTNMAPRRQSSPPTQLRLVRSGSSTKSNGDEPRPLLEDIDEDPLTYFLTPSATDDEDLQRLSNADSDDDGVLDFDAGIEVAGRSKDLVRSVSPSTLEGLRRGRLGGRLRRAASPDFDSDGLTSEDDDDEDEDYIRFFSPSSPPASPPPFRDPRGLLSAMPRHNSTSSFAGFRSRSPVMGGFAYPGSSSFPAPSSAAAAARGRATLASRRGRSFTGGGGSPRLGRPGHLWREPSADVWSIEEETEEELMMSETRSRAGGLTTTKALQKAKPIKRVRFVLPGEE